jgi:ketosteroid isomerase-like protein
MSPTPDPLDGIRRVFDAFVGGDARALFEVIDEDAVWNVPGTARVSQTYRGRSRIFDLFRETRRLTDGTYLSQLQWAVADDEHAVAVYRASGQRLGRSLDIEQVLLIRHREGRWVEITAVPTDPPAFERFWAH